MTSQRRKSPVVLLAALSAMLTLVPASSSQALNATYLIHWIDESGHEGTREGAFTVAQSVDVDGDGLNDVAVELSGAPTGAGGPAGTVLTGDLSIQSGPDVRALVEVIVDPEDEENPDLRVHFGLDGREERTSLPVRFEAPFFVIKREGATGFDARARFIGPGRHIRLFGGSFTNLKEGTVRGNPTYVEARLEPVPASLRAAFLPLENSAATELRELTLQRNILPTVEPDIPTTVEAYFLTETLESKLEAHARIARLPRALTMHLLQEAPVQEVSVDPTDPPTYEAEYRQLTYRASDPVAHARITVDRWDRGASPGGGALYTTSVIDATGIPATEALTVLEQTRAYEADGARWTEENVTVENPDPVQTIEFGFAENRFEVEWAPGVPIEEEYVKIYDVGTQSSTAGRVHGLTSATMDTGDPLMLGLEHDERRMRIDVRKDFLVVEGHISNLPAEVSLTAHVPDDWTESLDADERETTGLSFEGSSEIGELRLHAFHELRPIMGRADEMNLTARGIPRTFDLSASVPEEDSGIDHTTLAFDAKEGDLDSFELSLSDGSTTTPRFAPDEDGIAIVDLDDEQGGTNDHDPYAVWARLSNVKSLWADLREDCVSQPPEEFEDEARGYRRCHAAVEASLRRSESGDVRIYSRGVQVIPGSEPDAWKEIWSDLRLRDLAREVTIETRTVEERWTSEVDASIFHRSWTFPYADTLLSDITLMADEPSGPLVLETNAGMRDRLDLRVGPLSTYTRICSAMQGAGWNESGACIDREGWKGKSFLIDSEKAVTVRLNDCVAHGHPRCDTSTELFVRGEKLAIGIHDDELQKIFFDTDAKTLRGWSEDVEDGDLVAVMELPPGFWMRDVEATLDGNSVEDWEGVPNCPRRTRIQLEVFLPWYLGGFQVVADAHETLCLGESPV